MDIIIGQTRSHISGVTGYELGSGLRLGQQGIRGWGWGLGFRASVFKGLGSRVGYFGGEGPGLMDLGVGFTTRGLQLRM